MISRDGVTNVSEDLLRQLTEDSAMSPSYLVFMSMAGVLAAVAMLVDSVPILIGAMVVAPVFKPLSMVAFGFAGGLYREAAKGLGTTFLGLLFAIGFAVITTWGLNHFGIIDEGTNLLRKPLLEERLRPGWYSVVAALAAGMCGAVAVAKNKIDTLVGIVAAIALVPAGGAAGIAFMSGAPIKAAGGLILLLVNVTIIIAVELVVIAVMRPQQAPEQQLPSR